MSFMQFALLVLLPCFGVVCFALTVTTQIVYFLIVEPLLQERSE